MQYQLATSINDEPIKTMSGVQNFSTICEQDEIKSGKQVISDSNSQVVLQ